MISKTPSVRSSFTYLTTENTSELLWRIRKGYAVKKDPPATIEKYLSDPDRLYSPGSIAGQWDYLDFELNSVL